MPSERAREETWRREKSDDAASPPPRRAPDPVNRRRHPRFSVDQCAVTVYRSGLMASIGLKKENLGTRLLDLSEGGMRVGTSERLQVGTRVRVRLVMEKYSDEIEAAGEVRWSATNLMRPSEHTAGIMFTRLDPQHSRKIVNMRNWFTSPQYRQKRDQREKTSDRKGFDLIP